MFVFSMWTPSSRTVQPSGSRFRVSYTPVKEMTTDYTVGDRDYWVAKARARGWAIHKLITDNEKLEARVKELETLLEPKEPREG